MNVVKANEAAVLPLPLPHPVLPLPLPHAFPPLPLAGEGWGEGGVVRRRKSFPHPPSAPSPAQREKGIARNAARLARSKGAVR